MEYDFVLRFKLAEDSADAKDLVERSSEAGCDDAVVGIGQPGRIALNFTREADSAQQAFISALEDVRRVVPDIELIEASPDLAPDRYCGIRWRDSPASLPKRREHRLGIRLSAAAKKVLQRAASAQHKSISAFMLDSGLTAAAEALADRRESS